VTSRIYYTDPYCRRFEAVVTRAFEHEGRPAALLDRTAFYPTSGGQPFDTGRLLPGPFGSAIDVIDTIDADDEVLHILSAPLAVGAAVSSEVDWTRRFDHMQQHTGQHVLSAAFGRLFENPTTSFHMGTEISTIDLARDMSWEQIARAEDEANRIIWENREVAIRFVSADEASTLRLRKEPARTGVLRLIDVKEFDLSACGGTHVARTGAIGTVVVGGREVQRRSAHHVCVRCALRMFEPCATPCPQRACAVGFHDLLGAIERVQAERRTSAGRSEVPESLALTKPRVSPRLLSSKRCRDGMPTA
jgi:alanyl-tRNA synthetase